MLVGGDREIVVQADRARLCGLFVLSIICAMWFICGLSVVYLWFLKRASSAAEVLARQANVNWTEGVWATGAAFTIGLADIEAEEA